MFLNGGILNAATANVYGSSATNRIAFNGGTLQAGATGASPRPKPSRMGPMAAPSTPMDNDGDAQRGYPSSATAIPFRRRPPRRFRRHWRGSVDQDRHRHPALDGSNTFGGGIIINNGTVQDGNAAAGTLGTGYVTFGGSNAPTLDLNGNSPTFAGLIGASTNGVVTSSSGTTPVVTLNGVISETFGGSIQNGSATSVGMTLNLTDSGAVQTLTGTSTYTGPTTITSGTLVVNGALGQTAVTVNGGVIGGSGSIAGPAGTVTVNAGGKIAPSVATPGTPSRLSITGASSVTSLNMAGTYQAQLISTGVNNGVRTGGTDKYDQINVGGGNTVISGLLSLNDTAYLTAGPVVGDQFYIIEGNGGSTTGAFSNAPGGMFTDSNGQQFSVVYDTGNPIDGTNNDVLLTAVSAVPEPATAGLLGLTSLGLLARCRRRHASR